MPEPTTAHLHAVERVLMDRRGFRQEFDAITFDDVEVDEDEEWTPIQRDLLTAIARAVLEVEGAKV